MQINNIRTWTFGLLDNNLKSVTWLVENADPQALTTYRDGGTGWTVLEVLCHLREFEAIFLQRLTITVEQENPPLPFPNPDELAAQNHYSEQNIDDVLAGWKAARAELVAYAQARSESDWERTAVHPKRGILTLFEQFCLGGTHDSLHIEQMTRILKEKKVSA